MKVKALVTALVLSVSSAALAKPLLQVDYGANVDLSIRDHRGAWRPQWAPLSQSVRAGGRTAIDVREARGDKLTAIRLQHATGATYIYSLTLRFDDGSRETIQVNKWIYSRTPMLTFDLPQQKGGLDRIVVSSFSWGPSTFQVMGKQMRRIVPVEPNPPPPPPPSEPIGFTAGKDLAMGTDGYVHVPVGSDKGRFTRMQIESLDSGTFIGQLHVIYATGNYQVIDVNRALYRGEKLDLQLEGKGPQAITALTIMAQGTNVRAMSPAMSRFNVTLF